MRLIEVTRCWGGRKPCPYNQCVHVAGYHCFHPFFKEALPTPKPGPHKDCPLMEAPNSKKRKADGKVRKA